MDYYTAFLALLGRNVKVDTALILDDSQLSSVSGRVKWVTTNDHGQTIEVGLDSPDQLLDIDVATTYCSIRAWT
jgi:hypothetical protein